MKKYLTSLKNAPLLNTDGLSRDLGKVMIVAPHPDDESLGCGGLITYLRAQKAEVWILFMTNGEASHPDSIKYPPESLGELRKKEAIKACKILGVAEDHLIFLDAGDGNLVHAETDSLCVAKLKDIFQQKKADTIFAPWRRDHHSDHVATSSLVRKATEAMDIVIAEYPIWLWKKGKPEDWPVKGEILPFKLAIDSVKKIKKEAIEAHLSQTTNLIDDDPEGFILSPELLEPFLGDYEYFFFPAEAKPAVSGIYFDKLYAENKDPWNFETSAYEQKKYQKTLEAVANRNFNNALEIGCANGVFTSMFAGQCKKLLGIDLSEAALKSAKQRCAHLPQCRFLKWDISKGLPGNNYDAIILSEVGYYFQKEKLEAIFKEIAEALLPGGILLMVHWTAYVRSYPLTGLQVHQIFKENHSISFKLLTGVREDLYELLAWEKLEK